MKHKMFLSWKVAVIAFSLMMLGHLPKIALADGTETLGPPSIAIEQGTGIVAAGTGLCCLPDNPGTIEINVPGTVVQVLLYWEGQNEEEDDPAQTSITVNSNVITGDLIGGPTFFFNDAFSSAYRADITDLNLVGTGDNTLTIEGVTFTTANNGAGVLVIFDEASNNNASIEVRDGVDLAFINFPPPRQTTIPQTFDFPASSSDRTATLSMFFSSVAGEISGGEFRPNSIEITTGGTTTVVSDLLGSNDGEEWDTLNLEVIIPAGATSLTVQAFSRNDNETEDLPASLAWVAAGLSVPLEEEPPECKIRVKKKCRVLGGHGYRYKSYSYKGKHRYDCVIRNKDGANVKYVYKVTNLGDTDIENITVIDDVLGEIPGSPIASLGAHRWVTLKTKAFINENTTNTVTVTGSTAGSNTMCMDTDSLTVRMKSRRCHKDKDKGCRKDKDRD